MTSKSVLIAAAVLCGLAACGVGDDLQGSSGESVTSAVTPQPVCSGDQPSRIHVDYADPAVAFYIFDWAAHGDIYGTFEITDIAQLPISEEELGRDEGVLVGQTITIKIESILWQRPGAPLPPDTLTFQVIGGTIHEGELHPSLMNNSPELVVGISYVGVFKEFSEDGWSILNSDSIAVVGSDGRI